MLGSYPWMSGKVAEGVTDVVADLCDWSKNILRDLEKRIKYTKKALEACRRRGSPEDSVAKEEILKYKLEKLEIGAILAPEREGSLVAAWGSKHKNFP